MSMKALQAEVAELSVKALQAERAGLIAVADMHRENRARKVARLRSLEREAQLSAWEARQVKRHMRYRRQYMGVKHVATKGIW